MWAFCLTSFGLSEVDGLNTVNRFKLIIFANCIGTKKPFPHVSAKCDFNRASVQFQCKMALVANRSESFSSISFHPRKIFSSVFSI